VSRVLLQIGGFRRCDAIIFRWATVIGMALQLSSKSRTLKPRKAATRATSSSVFRWSTTIPKSDGDGGRPIVRHINIKYGSSTMARDHRILGLLSTAVDPYREAYLHFVLQLHIIGLENRAHVSHG
jgi:hypothetical protein